MAVLLAVALFSVILDQAKGLSASPQHSRYFGLDLELVSKELNHFGGIASFFRDWALGTLTGVE